METDMNQLAIYDFLLMFHSNNGPTSYSFRVNGNFRQKIAKFSTLPCI